MDTFGCCSLYVQCSDASKCLKAENKEYEGCSYRKNLEKGRIFYGKHANSSQFIKLVTPENKISALYIACFNQLFAVFGKQKTSLSINLSEDNLNNLANVFKSKGVPYKTKLNFHEELEGTMVEVDAPCNSRVVFTYEGQNYNVLNFNAYLIKNYYAQKIAKAFMSKGIESRVELVGSYSRHQSGSIVSVIKQVPKAENIQKPQELVNNKKFVQVSLFDIASQAG